MTHDTHDGSASRIDRQMVLEALYRALGRRAVVEPDVPLVEARLKINSLTMMALFAELERASAITIAPADALGLYGASIDQIVQWLDRRGR
ncbi:hypothetical protein NS383_17690 [Pseudomonas oryzihabitans]|nr:hypothetical protein NS383_17690 [Pseudomonas psychrotolerans]